MPAEPDTAPTITLRVANADDLAVIIALLHDDPFGATRNPHFADADVAYRAAFDAIQADPNNDYIVAEEAEPLATDPGRKTRARLIGCYQLTFIRGLSYSGGQRAQIESVRIAADLRGQGLGHAMMQDAIERARARGCTLVQLTTDIRREHTRRFYERLGFVASHHGMKLWL
jgi:ribosomal protein S18 acetylase RimI-like enzyme